MNLYCATLPSLINMSAFIYLIAFILLIARGGSTLLPTDWVNANAVECKPRSDGSPYCQPKVSINSLPVSTTIKIVEQTPILPVPYSSLGSSKYPQTSCEINRCTPNPIVITNPILPPFNISYINQNKYLSINAASIHLLNL